MKKTGLIIGVLMVVLCGIVIFVMMGGKKEEIEDNSKSANTTIQKDDTEEQKKYSTSAKAGKQCTEEEILEGQLVKVDLNDSKSEEFYVLADDGKKLTLIMNGTYDIETPWISSDDIKNVCSEKDGKSCGPYTAMKTLNEATKDWTKIDNLTDYAYKVNVENATPHYNSLEIKDGITTITGNSGKEYVIPGETKARLATVEELTKVKNTDWIRAKIAELYDAKKINHFYALTATPSYGGYDGTVQTLTCKYNRNFTKINVDNKLVLMPVITIDKSAIQ